MALLFMKCRNITRVVFKEGDGPTLLGDLMTSLARDARPEVPTILRNLRCVKMDLACDEPLPVLVGRVGEYPTLEEVTIAGNNDYVGQIDDNDVFPTLPPRTSNLKRLNFVLKHLPLREFEDILQNTKALESFSLKSLYDVQIDAQPISSQLLTYAQASLTSLRLRCRSGEPPLQDLCLKELSAFRGLKVVELSLLLICQDHETIIVPDLLRSIERLVLRDVSTKEYDLAISFLHETIQVKRLRLPRLS